MKTKLLLFLLPVLILKINAQQKIFDFSSNPTSFTKFNNNIFFEASKEETGYEIWKSNGTTENTALLLNMNVPLGYNANKILSTGSTVLGGKLFFIARDNKSRGEIWKTDGISETVKVTDFINGRVEKLTVVGNSIYFLMKTSNYVLQVWKTDGTKEGTVLVKDNLPIWNKPTFEGKCNGLFMFTFQVVGTSNSRLWRSDGTSEGTFPISEEMDGNGSGPGGTASFTQYIENGNKLYFVTRNYMFETDGTSENTRNIGSLWFGLANYSDVIEANGNLYFMFYSADSYLLQISKFGLNDKKITLVYSKQGQKYFYPSNLIKKDNSLIFCGPNSEFGTSLQKMNLDDYAISNEEELSHDAKESIAFLGYQNAAIIFNINENEYFVTTGINEKDEKAGYIYNNNLQTIEKVDALYNVWDAISFNNSLYYSKDNKLWKYANNLSIPVIENKSSLSFYPNPSSDFINVKADNDVRFESFQIFDLNGRMIIGEEFGLNDKIDISKLSQGAYLLKAKVNGTLISKKIIKK
ncbi:T9SS type A sorting domain-containing protein [Flavobacterium sp. DG2-3]|uniref:T9SS type A sorting domain-containing protein n=1 Tax=Flavobacterium sp. DG2-3 TaxID=3068317 RepID=UPI00273DEBC2|nr:T9SS type A sorting domain-containing protein [Flavobacterium sp. DG2-3]MDP5200049.1 T9SS type A sorting domain-containing protein [Flavobacterium sp. DG2-3]